ncbi:hypothetical protein [Mycoplasma sp. 246B]
MKKVIFQLGEPIAGLSGLSGINQNNVQIESKLTKNLTYTEKYNELEKVSYLSKSLFKNKDVLLDNIVENLMSKKKGTVKAVNEISITDFKELASNFVKIYKEKNVVTPEQQEKINNFISNDGYKKFKKELKTSLNNFKSNITNNKEQTKESLRDETKIKRVILDTNKGYVINIDNNEVNSKTLTKQFFELEKEKDKIVKTYKDINDNILWYNKRLKIMYGLQVGTAVASAFSFFLGIFSLGLGFIASGLSATTSFILSAIINSFETQRDAYIKNRKELKGFFNLPESSLLDGVLEGYSYAKNVISGWTWNIYTLAKNYKRNFFKFSKVSKCVFVQKMFVHIPWFELDILDGVLSGLEIKNIDNMNAHVNDYLRSLENKLKNIASNLDNIKPVEWVVVKETPLNKPYNQGGIGGRNLVFKNLKTNEVLTLNQMLDKPDWLLHLWGLQKVYNKKYNYWYIRKLPNKTKTDNLG